jgi:tetrapyrrole methylase family protein / MazG family protein
LEQYLLEFQNLNDVMKKLISEEGCPWDREQSHSSLKHYLIEETYEFLEAIDEDNSLKMEEELGDILFHVVFHSAIAKKNSTFTLASVIEKITSKMIRRHPHVFSNTVVHSVEDVWENWDQIKNKEKESKEETGSLLNNIPINLPALLRAEKLQKRAARVGFDWANIAGVWEKIHEEIDEIKDSIKKNDIIGIKEEIGDALFSLVNLARKYDIDPEEALQKSNNKFIKRFSYMQDKVKDKGNNLKNYTLEEMDALWKEAKLQ